MNNTSGTVSSVLGARVCLYTPEECTCTHQESACTHQEGAPVHTRKVHLYTPERVLVHTREGACTHQECACAHQERVPVRTRQSPIYALVNNRGSLAVTITSASHCCPFVELHISDLDKSILVLSDMPSVCP